MNILHVFRNYASIYHSERADLKYIKICNNVGNHRYFEENLIEKNLISLELRQNLLLPLMSDYFSWMDYIGHFHLAQISWGY